MKKRDEIGAKMLREELEAIFIDIDEEVERIEEYFDSEDYLGEYDRGADFDLSIDSVYDEARRRVEDRACYYLWRGLPEKTVEAVLADAGF